MTNSSSRSRPALSSPSPLAMTPTRAAVRKIAIGSLVPDSTSSVERTLSRMLMPPVRSRKNTAAASVEATIEPSSSPSSQENPSRKEAATPNRMAVRNTPSVASVSAGTAAWRKEWNEVP